MSKVALSKVMLKNDEAAYRLSDIKEFVSKKCVPLNKLNFIPRYSNFYFTMPIGQINRTTGGVWHECCNPLQTYIQLNNTKDFHKEALIVLNQTQYEAMIEAATAG